MIRIIALWLSMGLFIPVCAQVVTVTDASNNEPLPYATIASPDTDTSVTTDQHGRADISAFQPGDSLSIQLMGYQPLVTGYAALKASGYAIQLAEVSVVLDEVVISSYQENAPQQTSLHIEPLPLYEIEQQGTFNLTDALARVPGVSQLTSGIGISKPVIRGLFGNRILVLFSGLRFDNQQWQDEHGLGLSDIGISRVEVIKGPLSMLYGTEAVGGVINIIEERPPAEGTSESDAKMEVHSNTRGGTLQAGTKANYRNKWYRLRMAATNHADYSDGNNTRVLNSRFNGYYLKGTFGFTTNQWRSENHYHFSYNNFGFVFSEDNSLMEVDERWSRQMAGPHHIVMLNMLSSVNHRQLANSELHLNAGVQSNLRSEDEGGGELSLVMHLLTAQYALKWDKSLGENVSLVIANNTSMENNTNYGRRKIVPDAWMAESALSAYLKHQFDQVILEYGVGGGLRHIKTRPTPTVNSAEKDILPFEQSRWFSNGMLGVSVTPNDRWNVKFNLSSGVRAPNLAELSSNGLHEGVYTYEIGDPNMKNEQNLNGDAGLYYAGDFWDFSLSGFYNQFDGYIYLEPTSEEWFGFPIYRFRQHDAHLYGGEATVGITPSQIEGLMISGSYSGLIGRLDNGEHLPYIPARKLKPEIRYTMDRSANASFYGFVNADFVLQQDRVNSEENPTPAYQLLNAGLGLTFHQRDIRYNLTLAANNLLNEAYYDHMSRYKNFGLLNLGRDITLTLNINFTRNLKKP